MIANFSKQVSAQNVDFGTAEYNSADQTIDWTLRKLTGGQETTFSGRGAVCV